MEREGLGRQDEREDASITHLLRALQAGDRRNFDELFSRVYDQLQELAHRVRRGSTDQTLNTTALVHEAYVKLLPSAELEWESRAHFFSVAARAMRQILVSSARKRLAQKRGGVAAWAVTFDEAAHAAPIRAAELVAIDAALSELQAVDPRRASVVEHRFFAGLTTDETARVLGVSTGTVERDWRAARAWLTHRVGSASS